MIVKSDMWMYVSLGLPALCHVVLSIDKNSITVNSIKKIVTHCVFGVTNLCTKSKVKDVKTFKYFLDHEPQNLTVKLS